MMNPEQQKRFDELLEKEFPTDRFIEKRTSSVTYVECTCGWKASSRKRNEEDRRLTIRAAKNAHLDKKH